MRARCKRQGAYAPSFTLYDAMWTLYSSSPDLLAVIDGLHCGPTSARDVPPLLLLLLLLLPPPLLPPPPLRAGFCALGWALWKGASLGA